MSRRMVLYEALSGLPAPRSYVGKFLLVAFIGVHVPLITVAVWVVSRAQLTSALPILGVMLAATLIGTLVTLVVQAKLLAPLLESTRALQEFVDQRQVPTLPTRYPDEAGLLMRNTQQCLEHLDELLTLKNNLLATVSHDARSPLTSIKLASQLGRSALAGSPEVSAEIVEMFDVIDAASDRQMSLMQNLLTMARSDTGKLTADIASTDPATLVRRVADSFQIQAADKGVELAAEVPAEQPVEISIDAAKTEQILSNLVSNALKYTPTGGRVVVGLRPEDDCVEFYVRDTGVGIPEKDQSTLFMPFGGSRAGTAQEAGSGLGLWICRTFAEVQGGSVTYTTEEGAGTEFVAAFPTA